MAEEKTTNTIVIPSALATIADYGSDSESEECPKSTKEVELIVNKSKVEIKQQKEVTNNRIDYEIEINDGNDEDDVVQSVIEPLSTMVSNPFDMRTVKELEDALSDDELPALNISDDDSDVEFNRILAYTAIQRKKEQDKSMGVIPSKRIRAEPKVNKEIEREYEKLPPIENLSLNVEDKIPLKRLGSVKHIVDCLVIIEADSGLTIDYDSIIFKSDRSAIGRVFDIFGAVRCPLYSIRFNTKEEAESISFPSMEVFVANDEEYTKAIFTDKLRNEKDVDSVLVLNKNGEEEIVFSDDEAEKAYRQQNKRGRGRGRGGRGRGGNDRGRGGHFNQMMSWPPNRSSSSNVYNSPYSVGGPPIIDTRFINGGPH